MVAPPLKEIGVILSKPELCGAVGEMVLAGTPRGVVAGVDPHAFCDRTEFAYGRPDHIAALHDVGVIAKTAFAHRDMGVDLGPFAKVAVDHDGSFVDVGSLGQQFHSGFLVKGRWLKGGRQMADALLFQSNWVSRPHDHGFHQKF